MDSASEHWAPTVIKGGRSFADGPAVDPPPAPRLAPAVEQAYYEVVTIGLQLDVTRCRARALAAAETSLEKQGRPVLESHALRRLEAYGDAKILERELVRARQALAVLDEARLFDADAELERLSPLEVSLRDYEVRTLAERIAGRLPDQAKALAACVLIADRRADLYQLLGESELAQAAREEAQATREAASQRRVHVDPQKRGRTFAETAEKKEPKKKRPAPGQRALLDEAA